jgi:hypothetical protein
MSALVCEGGLCNAGSVKDSQARGVREEESG